MRRARLMVAEEHEGALGPRPAEQFSLSAGRKKQHDATRKKGREEGGKRNSFLFLVIIGALLRSYDVFSYAVTSRLNSISSRSKVKWRYLITL